MGPLTVFEITPDGKGGTKIQRSATRMLESMLCETYVGEQVDAHPLRRRRPHRGRARAVERRLQHPVHPPRAPIVVYQRNDVTNEVLCKQRHRPA